MGLEESVQQVVMEAIQELMTKEIASTSPPPPQEALAHVEGQLKRTTEEKDEALQRCHELDHQVSRLDNFCISCKSLILVVVIGK